MGLSIRSSEFSFWFSHCCSMTCQVKSLPFSFLGWKGTADPLFPCQGTEDELHEIQSLQACWVCKNQTNIAKTHSLRRGCTYLSAETCPAFASVGERCGGEATPTTISHQGTAGMQHHSSRSALVFPLSLMYGEHPPAIAFYSSSVLQKHYKMETVRAQDQGQSLHS